MVLLVHHGDALSQAIDPQRPLSERGRRGAETLALEIARRGFVASAVWHSGKLRARQTAEAVWRASNPLAEFAAIRGLQPDDPASIVTGRLAGETRDVAIVGHFPHLPRLLAQLLGAAGGDAGVLFPPHGAVALAADSESRWREVWRIEEPPAPAAAQAGDLR
jgi:phosphohistidine phosphatase